ncbi:MAG: hypothetical protein BRC45_03995 [Cyanobacteria bacterium QS_5_48_63]|jgi:hypothetical protein|nr:MAG: hypothetical protein BRC45_03995 [Cyanobacteria bacterium QS_5_48_63]
MSIKIAGSPQKKPGNIQLSILVSLVFLTAFFPRFLEWLNFPAAINFLHLILVPWLCVFTLAKTRVKDRNQISIVKEMLFALLIFFGITVTSAWLNNAGIINVVVDYLLLCEHFLLLLAIISISMTPERLAKLRACIVFASFTNLFFAYIQRFILNWHLREGGPDNITGVFIGQGAGHVVGASVAMTFGLYYFTTAKNRPLWLRCAVAVAALGEVIISDAKQVLFVSMVAGILLLVSQLQEIGKALTYLIVAVILGGGLFWAAQNLSAFAGFNTWVRPEIYGLDGEATLLKTSVFRIVPSYYESPLHPWLGLGPGHTVGRLGGWMLEEYNSLLESLGATQHPASDAVWAAVSESWLGDQSSFFSPLFGWAGIWGDLGFLGLASFIYIWFVVWRRLCLDDISRFLVLTVVVFGLIFSQMEEPGYMLYVASIIGLRWQEHQCRKKDQSPFSSKSAQRFLQTR